MDALTGKLLAGRYQLFERLEETMTALTYRGQDRRLGSACRVVVPQLSARAAFGSFERTWRLLGNLSSPHLASMTEQGRLNGGRPYVVFGWIEGRTLHAILQAEGPQSAGRATAICQAVLLALRIAHQHGIVHRDITPANVVIGHGPDAGAIKLVGFAGAPRDVIDARAVTGDPHAQAPERFTEPSVATPLTDLYAVGVLLYTLLAGQPPFLPSAAAVGESDTEKLAWLHAHASPQRPNTGVPDALWRLTLSLLEKRPSDRPPSADAVINALRAAGQTSAPPPFVTGDASLSGDPFQSTDISMSGSDPFEPTPDPFDIDLDMGSVNISRTSTADEDDTIADGPALLDDDDDEEPTIQTGAPALAVAASMFFNRAPAAKPGIDPFAQTLAASNEPEEIEAEASAEPVSAEHSVDRLAALVQRDPLAIEAEHDSVNSDILDELTLPDRAAHMRAMLKPRPERPAPKRQQPKKAARAIDDDQPTVPLREPTVIPEITREPILKPAAALESIDEASAEITRGGRPSNRLQRAPQDPLARVPDVSAFSDVPDDEISTIAAPGKRSQKAAEPLIAQKTAPQPTAPQRSAAPANVPSTTVIQPRRPLNLPAQQRSQRIIGIAIGVAALLALVSGLMWFTGKAEPVADPAPQPPVRTQIGE